MKNPRKKYISGKRQLDKIAPKRHQKYSPNLYKWLKRNPGIAAQAQVWREDNTKDLWIGFLGDDCLYWTGAMLMQVLCTGAKHSTGSYSFKQFKGMNVVENFWKEYIRIGRCAIDPEHKVWFLNSDTRYVGTTTGRKCQWCGQEQELIEEKRYLLDRYYKNVNYV